MPTGDNRQIMPRQFGWVPPTDRTLSRLRFASAPASDVLANAPEADSVDLSDRIEIVDQGNLGSCVAQAGCQALHSEMGPGAEFPSRLWGYQLALSRQGTEGKDVGTNIATFFDVIADHGFPRERHWPYDIQQLNHRPHPTAWRLAHDQHAVKSTCYHQIAGDRAKQVRRALTAGHLVPFGTGVSDDFVSNNLQPVNEPPVSSDIVGLHAMVICGYKPMPFGFIYKIANSWSRYWGNGGFCWFSESYLTAYYSADFWFVSEVPSYSDEVSQ